jgi:hypothetical protein
MIDYKSLTTIVVELLFMIDQAIAKILGQIIEIIKRAEETKGEKFVEDYKELQPK